MRRTLAAWVAWLRGLSNFERFLLVATVFGACLHVSLFWLGRVLWDGGSYAYIGGGFSRTGAFAVEWDPDGSYPLWEFGVLYPAYLAVFYSAFGVGVAATKTAAVAASVLAIWVGYATTRNLFDRTKGLVVAALVSLDVTLLRANYHNYAEPFLLLLIVPAFWALLKGLKDSRYMLAFGFFAGLFYLSKTIIGWSFLVVGAAALLVWRWYHVRGRLWRDPHWFGGVAILLAFVGIREAIVEASGRTVETHGLGYGLGQPDLFLPILAAKLPFLVLLLAVWGGYWLPELWRALRRRREPEMGILWLSIAGVAGATWVLISVIALTEPHNPLFWQDNLRYTSILAVPIMWLAFRETDLRSGGGSWLPRVSRKRLAAFAAAAAVAVVSLLVVGFWLAAFLVVAALALLYPSPRKRVVLIVVVFAVMGTNAVTLVDQPAFIEAAGALNVHLWPGDVVAIDRHVLPNLNPEQLYIYVEVREIEVTWYNESLNTTFIMSQVPWGSDIVYDGYTRLGSFASASERTILSRILAGLSGGEGSADRHVVNLWQLNSTLTR